MNDPREMVVRPESGVTLEQDNRVEEMYHWGAMVVDLCDLPVEEYMKPMTVIGLGGGGDIPETMYTLYFKIDGVTVAQKSLKSGDPIPFSVNGEKDGRNFLGWFDGNTQYFEGALMPSKSLTLKAKYSCDVNFIFVEDGVEREVSAYTVDYNSKLTLTSIPSTENPGFNFLGWNPPTTEAVKVHTTFKAVFESITYTVVWNGYVDGPIIAEYKYGDALKRPEDPKKEGYTFKGWKEEIPKDGTVTSNLEFNPIFEVLKFNITLKQNYEGNVEILSSYTQDYGSVIVLPQIPSENGYSFTEWEGEYNGNTVPAFNIEYVTIKTINSYVLAYYVNGNLMKEDTYEYLSKIEPYEYIPEEGYEVTNWEGLPDNLIMPYNNVSAYCTTKIMKFTVSFTDQNGDVIYTVDNVEYGTVIGDIAQPVKEGYTYNVLSDVNDAVKENLTINGEFIIIQYDVTINGEIVSLAYGTDIIAYVNDNYKADEGYHIVITASHDTVPANNTATVEYVFEANIWVLTYSTEGADENLNGSKEVAFGTNILSALPSTTKEHYNFAGWFNNGTLITSESTMPNHDLTVNGNYLVNSYTVKVIDENDEEIFNKFYVYKTKLSSVLNDEAIVGYVTAQSASGQTVSFVLNGEPVNEEMEITSNIDIYVEKTPIEYLLTFMNGNEIISETLVKFGETIKYPPMENKTEGGVEYVFVWEDTSYSGSTMPAFNLTIIGKYEEKAVAPIYFGTFKVKTAEYDSSNVSKYFDENKLETEYYGNVEVAKCIGDGAAINVPLVKDEEYASLNLAGQNTYKKQYKYPYNFILPNGLTDEYIVNIIDGSKTDHWSECVTDNNIISYKGNEYKFYVYYTDKAYPVKNNGVMGFTLKLTKK